VRAEIRRGRTLAQVQALRLADAYGKPTDFVPPGRFIESVYNSLRTPPRHQAPHAHGELG
jgi:hypothetical protein